jgi:hypothetical protein
MKEKGLALRVTEVALLREHATIEITMSGFRTELARLSVTIGELDIKINEIESADHQRVANELLEVRTRLNELGTMLPSARRVRDVRLQQTENGTSSSPLRPSHRIVIRRMLKTGVKTLTASEETPLEPGDIVEVIWLSPDSDTAVYRRPMTRKQAQLDGYHAWHGMIVSRVGLAIEDADSWPTAARCSAISAVGAGAAGLTLASEPMAAASGAAPESSGPNTTARSRASTWATISAC